MKCLSCDSPKTTNYCPNCGKSPCPKCSNNEYQIGDICVKCGYENKYIFPGCSQEDVLYAMKQEEISRKEYKKWAEIRKKIEDRNRKERLKEKQNSSHKRSKHPYARTNHKKQSTYKKTPSKQKKKNLWGEWQGVIWIIIGLFLLSKCSQYGGGSPTTSRYPMDNSHVEAIEYQADMMEQDTRDYDPGMKYDNETEFQDHDFSDYPDLENDTPTISCPTGCTRHVNGCDIKGNISDSGEKIYHIPGQEYYLSTRIVSADGERWFCTETEARANGWRKSYK